MHQSVRLGRVAGIPIGAHWSVAVILAIIAELLAVTVLPTASPHHSSVLYGVVAVIAAVLFMASLGVHELAHALVARRNGVAVNSITLWVLGGVTELAGYTRQAGADLRIALAGPSASLAAAAVFLGVGAVVSGTKEATVVAAAATWLAVMNAVLAVFNLLPGAPLDGGRVLRAVLWRHYGDRERAERGATRAGRVLGGLIVGFGAAELLAFSLLSGLWLVLIGWFLVNAATGEERAAESMAALAGVRVADVMTPHPELAPAWDTVAEFIDRVAARSRQRAFPVVEPGGELIGVVLADQLARIPVSDRAQLRMSLVTLAVPPGYRAAPDDLAGPLLARRPVGGEIAAVVLSDGQVTGMVTLGDLKRALQWRMLARGGTRSGRT